MRTEDYYNLDTINMILDTIDSCKIIPLDNHEIDINQWEFFNENHRLFLLFMFLFMLDEKGKLPLGLKVLEEHTPPVHFSILKIMFEQLKNFNESNEDMIVKTITELKKSKNKEFDAITGDCTVIFYFCFLYSQKMNSLSADIRQLFFWLSESKSTLEDITIKILYNYTKNKK